jgi:hypothetical protein
MTLIPRYTLSGDEALVRWTRCRLGFRLIFLVISKAMRIFLATKSAYLVSQTHMKSSPSLRSLSSVSSFSLGCTLQSLCQPSAIDQSDPVKFNVRPWVAGHPACLDDLTSKCLAGLIGVNINTITISHNYSLTRL